MIVEIDYANTFSDPLLPIDFLDKKYILAKTKLDVLGIYNIFYSPQCSKNVLFF